MALLTACTRLHSVHSGLYSQRKGPGDHASAVRLSVTRLWLIPPLPTGSWAPIKIPCLLRLLLCSPGAVKMGPFRGDRHCGRGNPRFRLSHHILRTVSEVSESVGAQRDKG